MRNKTLSAPVRAMTPKDDRRALLDSAVRRLRYVRLYTAHPIKWEDLHGVSYVSFAKSVVVAVDYATRGPGRKRRLFKFVLGTDALVFVRVQ